MHYPGSREKCQVRLPRGTVAYYWPQTRTLLRSDRGKQECRSFLSAAADEDVYAGVGNPFLIEPEGPSVPFLFVKLGFQSIVCSHGLPSFISHLAWVITISLTDCRM